MKRLYLLLLFSILILSTQVSAQPAPEKYGWSFLNFTTPVFNWDIYRNSMFAIPPDSSGITSPFDLVFYNAAFKSALSAAGNCFGLSIMSLIMNKDGGQLGYCCPTNFYGGSGTTGPTDVKLTRAINIMHGHQVSLACIQDFFDQVVGGHSLLAHYGKDKVKSIIDHEGPCLVSITKGLSPTDGGHTLIAYEVQNLGGSHFHIMVIDPNRIWADSVTLDQREFYTNGRNYIDVTGDSWTYKMAMIGGSSFVYDLWPHSSQAHLTGTAVSIAGPTGRVPTSLGLAIGELMTKIFISDLDAGSGGMVAQVQNSEGKRLFKPGTEDIDWDPATGLRSMVPFFPSDAVGEHGKFPFELFYNMAAMPNAEVEFRSGSKGSFVAIGGNAGFIKLTTHEAGVTATIGVTGVGTASPSVSVKNASKPMLCDIEILIPTKRGEINRIYSLKDVEIQPGESSQLEFAITGARDVSIHGKSTRGSLLTISQQALDHSKDFSTDAIAVTPANGATWAEEEWVFMKRPPVVHLTGK
ncbi:MAG: hypothetical protein Q8916_13400 [Bacteroidota bacterium]|nr:hypothetical protein [Bacteroidota bacterium]MDP4231389.1 hypothetical protein [Bacteroidota bacterium]